MRTECLSDSHVSPVSFIASGLWGSRVPSAPWTSARFRFGDFSCSPLTIWTIVVTSQTVKGNFGVTRGRMPRIRLRYQRNYFLKKVFSGKCGKRKNSSLFCSIAYRYGKTNKKQKTKTRTVIGRCYKGLPITGYQTRNTRLSHPKTNGCESFHIW